MQLALSAVVVLAAAIGAQAARDVRCTINTRGEIKTYDNSHLLIFPETTDKSLMTRWDEERTNPCKFRVRIVPLDGKVLWTALSVGVHKNANKFWRNFAFDRFSERRVEIRGWKALRDIVDSEIPFTFEGVSAQGTTEATLYGDYDTGYVINSTTCPGFEFKYTPNAPSTDAEVELSIDSTIYQTAGDKLRGWCQNANGDKDDDFRLCRTLEDVADEENAMELISASCAETDKTCITI